MTPMTPMTPMTRTFIAIEPTEAVRAALARALARLARAVPAVAWAHLASLHLTLAFLGALDEARLLAATEAALEVAPRVVPFHLEIAGLGTFGAERAPRVVWAGLGGELGALLALQGALADALAARGFAREARPFAPHLTLARVRGRLDEVTLARLRAEVLARRGPLFAAWPVERVSVMKSELLRPAARYTCLRAVPLGPRAT